MPRRKAPARADTANLLLRGTTWYFTALVAGRPFVRSLRTDDLAVAQERRGPLLKQVADARAGIVPVVVVPEVIPTWRDAVNEWMGHLEAAAGDWDGFAKTVNRYQTSVAQISVWLAERGIEKLTDITKPVLLRYIDHRMKPDEKGRKRSSSTVKNDLVAWGQVLGRAEQLELIGYNVVSSLDRAKSIPKSPDRLNPPMDSAVADMLAEVSLWSPEIATLIVWLRETGMRLDEALQLFAEDVHPGGQLLTITRGVKRDRARTIRLGRAAALLADLLKEGPLFPTLKSSRAVSSHYGQWCRQRQGRENRAAILEGRPPVKLYRFRLHDLRHAFAIASMIDDEDCIYRLQKHLGHTKIGTTEIYTRFLDGKGAKRKYARREDLFGSLPIEPPKRDRKLVLVA